MASTQYGIGSSAASSGINSPAPSVPNMTDTQAPKASPAPSVPTTTGEQRSKRNKRDSRKKREAKGLDTDVTALPPRKKAALAAAASGRPSTLLSMLRPALLAEPRTKSSNVIGQSWDFYEVVDKLTNKNGFRYSYAISDPKFTNIKYRQTDVAPYHARFSFEDSPAAIAFTKDGLAVTTTDAWHSARANVCAREGAYYYEAKVISGIVKDPQPNGSEGNTSPASSRGHVRLGFARREAELDVNVGVDCYGYGIRDVNGEVINRMRCEHFFDKGESIAEGDVIGLLITLPPLSVHKKVAEGTYDPSADKQPTKYPTVTNFIRDRVPFHLKSDFCWQQSNIYPSKQLRDYAFNLKETPTFGPPSPFNSEDASLRTLPGSSITIFKNGVKMGTPFKELFAFLPPASRLTNGTNNLGIGERENADDGMIGYFPTVSCYGGGAVECRFEPPWWFGPPPVVETDDSKDEEHKNEEVTVVKPFGERFNDQIVEDIVADIVDEIEAMFLWGSETTDTDLAMRGANNAGAAVAKQNGKHHALLSPGNTSASAATVPTVISTEFVDGSSSTVVPATGQRSVDVVQEGVGAVYEAAMLATDAPPTVTVNVGTEEQGTSNDINGNGDHMSGLVTGTVLGSVGNGHDEDVEMT
ncbi:histone-lysine N-methyltransferase (Bre2), putative [Talaromyces stipitatus ATCC 10500]|uniref:Histone-lysine N-methyltransferase (Bre2), putative n=1 Tax=Talaromyces stipitatus (strain ATCC 10500 / CBS 375.48 / QM 6759 / NRRL 1006) TaxID=441959 RepID=B8MNW6_TALSN|nr:histone-lysine N-methyltransferase (Bre2), putative [Talaromyces stipitatus ATCC 10500]EED14205.1 histone-lysine N-methyltransferase (Bre2), putative [Talaromyces stipitatus ATCC 10500]